MYNTTLKAKFADKSSPYLVILPDSPRFTIVDIDKAYCKASHKRAADLKNKGLFEAFADIPNDPDSNSKEILSASLNLVIATKTTQRMGYQKHDILVPESKDIEERYWSPENYPVLNEQGDVAFIIHSITKITEAEKAEEERKIAELSMRLSEAKYRAFFENSMDAILLTITDGQIIAANPAACEIFRMTEKEICDAGRYGLADITDPRLTPLLAERQLKGKVMGELTLVRKDGSKFPGELTSSVFEDSHGEIITSMIIRDITHRKEAENQLITTTRELQEALNDLSKILDSSIDVICTMDEAGKFVIVSAAAEKMWGYKPQELIGKPFLDFVGPEEHDLTRSTAAEIMSGREMTYFENQFIRKDGSKAPNVWSMKWVDTEKTMYCIAKDISVRKSMEKAFQIESQRFQDLYSQAPSCMGMLKGPNHVYELANPLYLQLIGKSDIIGKSVKEVLPELEAQGVLKLLDTVYKTGQTFSASEMLVKFDLQSTGELSDSYLNFIYQAHRNQEGTIDGIFFFAIDVTEQVLSRKKIEFSENRFKTLIHEGTDLISIVDKNRIYKYLSPAYTSILGIEPEELIGTTPVSRVHKDDLERVVQTSARLENEKRVQYLPFRYRVGNDQYRWIESVATNLLDDPAIQGILFNSTDITERMNYIQEIEDQNIKLKEIAWIQSHLVRAPVVRILGLIDLIKNDKDSNDQAELLSYIYDSTQELDVLIKDIVDKTQKIDL